MKRPDPRDARTPFSDSPGRRLKAEAYTFLLTFLFHDNNNHLRKALTILLFGVWAILYTANSLDSVAVTLPDSFEFLTLFVGIVIARMWNIEFNNFAQLPGMGDSGGDNDE